MTLPKLFWGCLILVLAIDIQGCGLSTAQRKEIENFGQSATTLGASGKEQLISSRELVIDMKSYRLAIEKFVLPAYPAGNAMSPRDYYFLKSLDLDAGLDPKDMDVRVAAVDLLHQYGKLLVAFTTESHEKAIKDSANAFVKSVTAFPRNPMTTDEINGLGRIVTSIGGILTEHWKKDALEQVVPMVAPLIDMLCNNLEKDFDPRQNGIYGSMNTVQDRLASAAIEGLKMPGDSSRDRLMMIDGFAMAEKARGTLTTTSSQLLKAIASLRKANRQLSEVISSHKVGFNDIKEFGQDVADLSKGITPYFKRF